VSSSRHFPFASSEVERRLRLPASRGVSTSLDTNGRGGRCRSQRQDNAPGFTLIELLVGLAILGMMAAMLVAGLGTTGLMAARTRAAADALEPVAAAQMVLRGRLERLSAVPRLTSAVPIVDIEGNERAFDFTGAPPDRDMPDALYRYRLAMTSGGDVILYSAPVLARETDEDTPASWQAIRLAERATSLSITYFGDAPVNDGLGGGRRWLTFWTDRPQPPDLVRVRVSFAPGDRRVWPDLIVRPRATVNNACRIDAVSGRCRDT
jgi:general secretion pathway protein J